MSSSFSQSRMSQQQNGDDKGEIVITDAIKFV